MSDPLIAKLKPDKTSVFFLVFLFALYLTPLVVYFKSSDIYFLSKSIYIKSIVVFLVISWVFQINKHQEELVLKHSILTLPFGLFIMLHFVSWIFALNVYEAASYTAGVFCFFLLYLALLNNQLNLQQLYRSMLVIFGVGGVVALYGILQHQGIDFVVLEAGSAPVSTLGNVNFSAQYLVMLSPMVLLFCFWETNWIARLSMGIVWGLINIHILLTYSRGGWVGLFISLVFLTFLVVYLKKEAWQITRFKIGISFIVLFIVMGGFLATDFGRKRILPQVKSIVNPTHGANLGRLLIWRSTMKIIRDYPWGVGAENYKFVYPLYRDQREWTLSGRNSRLERAHNDYLQIAAELGVVGLGVFLWLVGSAFYQGLRVVFHPQIKQTEKVIAAALMCGLVAGLGHALFSFPFRNPASTLTFFLLLSFIAVLGNLCFPSPEQEWRFSLKEPAANYYYSLAGQAVLILVLLVLGLNTIALPFIADRIFQDGRLFEIQKKYDHAEVAFKKAVAAQPHNYKFLIHLGNTLSRKGKQSEAIEIYKRYLALDPSHRNTYNNLGNAYEANKEYDKAVETFQKAIKLDPIAAPAYLNLGNVYMKTKEFDKSIATYQKVLEINDKYPAVHHNLGDAYGAKGEFAKSNKEYLKAAYDVKTRPFLYQKMGYNFFQLHDYSSAIKYLEEIFSLTEDPKELYQTYKFLGNVYFQKGKEEGKDIPMLEKALHMWQKTIQIEPSDKTIKNNITELSALINEIKAARSLPVSK